MANDDLIYMLRRATEEKIKALKATDNGARAAHIGMAEAYDARLGDTGKTAPISRTQIKLRTV